jgi:glutamate--cysteine ligase
MSNPGEADATPITSRRQLADWFAEGCKPPSAFRIGTEHEKFGFRPGAGNTPPPYAPDGIAAVLERLQHVTDARPITDRDNLIGLKLPDAAGGGSISLEPAGQFELSGAAVSSLHETRAEFERHFASLRAAAEPLGIGFAPLGFHPTLPREAMPWMPKGRYAIMRRYMPMVGRYGLDMMTRTCTVQVNLDFASETDMRRKLRVSLALQPLASALFANAPFTEGRPNGLLSQRCLVWTDVDNARSGIPAVILDPGFDFAAYVNWLVDCVPMYFVLRDGVYYDVAGASFADYMAGRLHNRVPTEPTMGDFADHTTTVFTDVRLKRFLEMRGSDAGNPAMMLAQSALWVGLLYDDAALSAAESLVGGITHADLMATREAVPRDGLNAPWQGRRARLRDIAGDVIAIARRGLDARGLDEGNMLDPIAAIAAGAPTQAEYWLSRYDTAWGGDVSRIFAEAAV